MNAKQKSAARKRILETANRLFNSEGIRAVGIDRIIAEAKVAKMTLYNHFASKDELIVEVLRLREEQVLEMFEQAIEKHMKKGLDRFDAFFAALQDWFRTRDFRGCSFINATAEIADRDHDATRFSAAHKQRFHKMVEEFVIERGGADAKKLAPAVSLLVEGAIVRAVMSRSARHAKIAAEAATRLLEEVSSKKK